MKGSVIQFIVRNTESSEVEYINFKMICRAASHTLAVELLLSGLLAPHRLSIYSLAAPWQPSTKWKLSYWSWCTIRHFQIDTISELQIYLNPKAILLEGTERARSVWARASWRLLRQTALEIHIKATCGPDRKYFWRYLASSFVSGLEK